jgi:V-type H+-transporting ATPase subunit C
MPSDQSTWLIAVPYTEGLVQELSSKLTKANVAELGIPSFKVNDCHHLQDHISEDYASQTGTLDLLISLSEDLPKQDLFFTSTVAKTVDTLRNLLNNDPSKLAQHILVNEKSVDEYILRGWKWNEGRYGVQKGLREMVDVLNKVCRNICITLWLCDLSSSCERK